MCIEYENAYVCVYVFVCVCVREIYRERQTDRQKNNNYLKR